MQVNIRGGTHYEFAYIPTATFGASLRGMDMTAWYTNAWFDRYVKGDPTALDRLLTDRWLDDAPGAAVDPTGDGNLFSSYYSSRVDVTGDDGQAITCEDLRHVEESCAGLLADDGFPADYSYLSEALDGPAVQRADEPEPVVPEAPVAALLPLVGAAAAGSLVVARRRRTA